MCGFLQFVPHTTAHQQYSSKELAHSYKCASKLKVYSALLVRCCAAIMEGKYFYQATKSTLMPGKAVATSCLLYKAANEERGHSRVAVCELCSERLPLALSAWLALMATTLVSPLSSPPLVRAVQCKL